MNKTQYYGEHVYYFIDFTVKRWNLFAWGSLAQLSVYCSRSIGHDKPGLNLCLCTVLAISDLKGRGTCLCLNVHSLNTFPEERVYLSLTLHPSIDHIFLANKSLSDLIRPETGLKFSVCNFIFIFLKPWNVNSTL